MRGLAVIAFLLVLAAGCVTEGGASGTTIGTGGSSGSPPAPASTSVAPPTDADPTKGVGAIEGTATDDELVPLPGVLIQVHPRDTPDQGVVELRSDDLGSFHIDGLVEGPYALYASKPGYEQIPARVVEVKADEALVVKVQLKKLPSLEPSHATETFVWQPQFAMASRTPPDGNGSWTGSGSGSILVNQSADGELRTIIVEANWQDSGLCTTNVRTAAVSPDGMPKGGAPSHNAVKGGAFYWDNEPNVTRTTHLYIPREGPGNDAITSSQRRMRNFGQELRTDGFWMFQTSLYPKEFMGQSTVMFGCAMGNKIETWVTIFYKQDAPMRTWSIFPKT